MYKRRRSVTLVFVFLYVFLSSDSLVSFSNPFNRFTLEQKKRLKEDSIFIGGTVIVLSLYELTNKDDTTILPLAIGGTSTGPCIAEYYRLIRDFWYAEGKKKNPN